ncbi:hypothetical protein EDD18DRAFT_196536 [Armillaria luteobubalina]|uniref:F-box domain-containing protein n=1 Tax=Armillaria luteobubalina TaxID=153913 RepID=A0AA39P120_9AGAR|nr:hypothetical protein EDD18DRAFT_196536 [Armillaria luteobubalina]
MLPVELYNLIIDHLHDSKPSLLACSLVCRAWVPECRFHLFYKVVLRRDTAGPFFQLLESPHATIASVRTHELIAKQDTIWNENLDCKLLENPDILSRCPADVFGHVKKLSVTDAFGHMKTLSVIWAGWRTLHDAERLSIVQRFKHVTEFVLWRVYFQTDTEFQALLASFPALGVLSLQTIRLQDNDMEENHLHAGHSLPANLHTISLNDVIDPDIMRSLIPCPLLRVFNCHYEEFDDFTPALANDMNRLLLSAGGRLEDFEFMIYADTEFQHDFDLDAGFKLIDVARIPNLRRIKFSIEDAGQYLVPFLRRLAESDSSAPVLETLDIRYLPQYDIDWEKLDDILQHSYFHALKKIKTTVEIYFDFDDVVGQAVPERPGWYLEPNDGSRAHIRMGRNIAKFAERLPKCQARGIVRLAKAYHFVGPFD